MTGGVSRRALLAAILLTGGILRFWGLSQRELSHYDEGSHWRQAYPPAAALRYVARCLADGQRPTFQGARAAVLSWGFPDLRYIAHNGYAALQSASMCVLGLKDHAGSWVNAILGTATILGVYRIGACLHSPSAGLLSAALLALSPNHVFYSRSALAQGTSVFFAYAGVLLLLHARAHPPSVRKLFTAGGFLGCSFVTHYNLFWVLPCAVAWVALERGKGFLAVRKAAWVLAGIACAPVAFEGVSTLAQVLSPAGLPFLRYSQEVVEQFRVSLQGGYRHVRSIPSFYLVHWVRTEGPLFTVLSLVAPMFLLGKGGRGRFALVACLILAPHCVYAWPALKAARTLLVAVPAACLCIGVVLAGLLRRPGAARSVGWGLLAVLLAWPVPLLRRVVEARGPYRRALAEIARRGAFPVTVDDYPILETYMRGSDILVAQKGGESWRVPFERIRSGQSRPLFLLALRKDGHYGFDDPVWGTRFEAVRAVVEEYRLKPAASLPFEHPLEFDYVDETFRLDRLFSLKGTDYAVDLFDLSGVR